ncbi:MAG: class I SAM-dependent methyltransferase [Desulfovibrionaceae bacterium]
MTEKHTLFELPEAAPDHLYALLRNAARGYKCFLALRVALDAGIFERLQKGGRPDALAACLGLDPQILEGLCALLVEEGLLDERGGKLFTSDDARTYLVPDSPLYQGAVLENIDETFALWGRLWRALKQGPLNPFEEGLFGGAFLPALAAETLAGEAQRTAALVSAVPGFSQVREVLDLGGGHGLYALALCARNPDLQAEIMDLDQVRPVAEANMLRFGAKRVRFTSGDVFHSDLGTDRDAVLLFYNPGGKRFDLLERIHACLAPGGIFVSKHAFYSENEGSKDPLVDLEWRMTAFPGVSKGPNVYRFQGDLCYEAYRAELESRFEILADHGPEAFAAPNVGKFGDRLDSRLIVARKR